MLKNKKSYEWVKRLIKIALVFIAIALLVFAFIPEKVRVDLISVEKGDLTVSVEGEGKTRIHDIYTIYTPIEGRVTRIESNAGDSVTAGKTIIANMYPANPAFLDKRSQIQAKANINGAEAALELASSRVRQAQAQLKFDQSEYNRAQELFNNNMISTAALERADSKLTMQQAEKDTSIANRALMASRLKAAQAELLQPEFTGDKANETCQVCIYSPVNGYVLRILHKSESTIPAGTALVEIGDLKDLEVNIEMLSTNAVKIQVGDKAFIKRWGGIEDLAAIVKVIEPSGFTKISALGVEEQRVNVILSLTAPHAKWKSLGDAFRVEAQIVIEEIKEINKIPLSALFRQNSDWSVLKVIDGEVILQAVIVGKRNNFFAEITQGLTVGEQVIMHPNNSIEVGMNVIQRL